MTPATLLKRGLLALLLFVGAVVGYSGYTYYQSPEDFSVANAVDFGRTVAEGRVPLGSTGATNVPADAELVVATVKRVVDGDTLLVAWGGREERVRLLCVDTPESVHPDASRNEPMGAEAAAFARSVLENRQIRLVTEPGNTHDRYGRRLAYVMHEGENFNVRLVREGYSEYHTKYGRSKPYHADFVAAERDAKAARRGIWARETAGLW